MQVFRHLCLFGILLLGVLTQAHRAGASSSGIDAQGQTWHQSYWDPATQERLDPEDVRELLLRASTIVLGEDHYNAAVQQGEADIIRMLADASRGKQDLVLGWEFLNVEDEQYITQSYAKFQQQLISTQELLQAFFPQVSPPMEYAPVMEAARDVGAELIPTNLSRAQKSPVTRGGIEALDPALLPPDFEMGGPLYFERFREAMGTHPLPYPVENYFAAQSLTDEFIATELLQRKNAAQRLLIVGSFHGDYHDGVVHSLQKRWPEDRLLYLRVLDARPYSETELKELFTHPRYGLLADLVLVVNEPR